MQIILQCDYSGFIKNFEQYNRFFTNLKIDTNLLTSEMDIAVVEIKNNTKSNIIERSQLLEFIKFSKYPNFHLTRT